jgi:hypothetical protein
VEGTKLDVNFQLNKTVKSAMLVAKDGAIVPLTVSPDKATAALSDFPVTGSATYELKLEDADGRTNKIAAQFTVDALKNRPPELKFDWPRGDQQVSPIEEVAFRGTAWDEFGLTRYGMTVNVAGRGDQEIPLGKETGADEKREFSHLLKLEDLGVKADDLVSWFLWAEDAGADGRTRRTESDIYFAEVRPFDQIYRRDNGGGRRRRKRRRGRWRRRRESRRYSKTNRLRNLEPETRRSFPRGTRKTEREISERRAGGAGFAGGSAEASGKARRQK